jgi:hypothetical protein
MNKWRKSKSQGLTPMVCVAMLLAVLPAGAVPAEAWTWEELVEVYGEKAELQPEAKALRGELLSEAGELEGVTLWKKVVDPKTPARQRAAGGLKLVEELFPAGNPGRWDEVSGLWYPSMVPKPLAAFDAVYYTVIGLLELDDAGAPWLAQQLLVNLKGSSRAAHLALREAPVEYETILTRLKAAAGPPPVGGWPAGNLTGNLPFARPVRFSVSEGYAMMKGMIFLNKSGVPVSGMGPFAWDREKGRIYRVISRDDDVSWTWGS